MLQGLIIKNYSCEKFDRHKWPTNGYIGRSTASLGRNMAGGRLLYCRLLIFNRSLQFKKNLEKIVTQKGLRNEEKKCDVT